VNASQKLWLAGLMDDLRIFPGGATEVLTAPIIELGDAIIAWCLKICRDHPKVKVGSKEHQLAARRSECVE